MGAGDDGARVAWRALQAAAATDERLRALLGQLAVTPVEGERALRAWLSQVGDHGGVPAEVATYVSGGHVEQLVNIARADTVQLSSVATPRAPTSLFSLPADIADFTGRESEIEELTTLLSGGGNGSMAVVISALAGKAGVGKSALAIHVAHRLRDRYPDAQLYVNLRGAEPERLDPHSVLADLLAALGFVGHEIPPSLDQRAAVYRAQLAGRRALVVLDNAHDEAQVRPLLPGSPSCAAIVTSRAPLSGLEGVRLRALDIFDRASAVELLGKLTGPERAAAEPEQATRIVELCGRLALAVRIAGGLLAQRPSWTLARLAQRLRDERRRLEELQLADLAVRTSFALSYDALDGEAQRVFRRLGTLAGPDFGSGVVAALDGSEPDAQLVETPAEDRYRLHDLVALFARERAEAEESPDDLRLLAARTRGWYLRLTQVADTLMRGGVAREALGERDVDSARARVLAWLALERANLVATIEQAHHAEDWQSTYQLAVSLTGFLSLRSHWDDWQHTHELALHAARRADDRHGEATVLIGLGLVYARQGRWEDAIACYDRSLPTMRELGDRHGEAVTLGNLGNIYADQWRLEDAIGCYEQSLAVSRELGDRRGEAQTLGNLGNIYGEQGRLEDAIGCLEHSLRITRETGDRHGEAQTLGNLGNVHRLQGRFEDAITCYEHCLPTMRELGDRHGEAQTLDNLGNVYQLRHSWQDAIACYEGSLRIARELGDRHGEAVTLGNLGNIYAQQERWEDAISCDEHSLQNVRELGDRHGEARTLRNLGGVYLLQGRLEDAITCYGQSLPTFRELGDRHGEADVLRKLGVLLGVLGDDSGAKRCLGDALALFQALDAPEAEDVRAVLESERWRL